jgi:IMP cyclohydrolase
MPLYTLKNAHQNIDNLRTNTYPGIVIGHVGQKIMQVYWIMAREAEKRAVTLQPSAVGVGMSIVKTVPTLPGVPEHVSLRSHSLWNETHHMVSSGNHTDDVLRNMHGRELHKPTSFKSALAGIEAKDGAQAAPRITGVVSVPSASPKPPRFALAVKYIDYLSMTSGNLFNEIEAGVGLAVHTNIGDDKPEPPFRGDAYELPLYADPAETAEFYWNMLAPEDRVDLVVKTIDNEGAQTHFTILGGEYLAAV